MPVKNSILIIDDERAVREEIKNILRKANIADEYYEASDGAEGFKILFSKKVDLVLCDLLMPRIDGLRFLVHLRGKSEYSDIPVIMLTGVGDVKYKLQSFNRGASDYITKPFDAGELKARVRTHLEIKNLHDELREKNRQLEELATTDGLTKIYNRRYFLEILDLEFQRAKRYGSKLAFIMIDVDDFKSFNDNYGHLLGDRILADVARILRENIRMPDQIGRYGGEEFSLMMPETDIAGAQSMAERLRRNIEEFSVYERGEELKLTISIGLAAYPRNGVETVDDLIKLADDALLEAKREGKNRIKVAA